MAYQRAEHWSGAGPLLGALGLFDSAARALLRALPAEPTPIDQLNDTQRKAVLSAALYFWRGKDPLKAAALMAALGENRKAAKLLWSAGEANAAQEAWAAFEAVHDTSDLTFLKLTVDSAEQKLAYGDLYCALKLQ